MDYKGKSLEKTLLRASDKIDVSDIEMRVVQVEGVKYYVQDEDDLVSLVHELLSKGYSIREIAQTLGVNERKVKRYLNDCW